MTREVGRLPIDAVPATRKSYFCTKTVGTVVRRKVGLTSGRYWCSETVPSDRLGSGTAIVSSLERAAGQYSEVVGERSDVRRIARVIARQVVNESSTDGIDARERSIHPLEVAGEKESDNKSAKLVSKPKKTLESTRVDSRMRFRERAYS